MLAFSNEIQKDFLTLCYSPRPSFADATQMIQILAGSKTAVHPDRVLSDSNIQMAAQRMIGVFAMAAGAITTLAALPYLFTATLSFVLMSAIGVSLFAAGHDLFVMANNLQKLGLQTDSAMASIAVNTENSRAVLQQLTAGTVFQPILSARLAQQAVASVRV